MTVAPSDEIVPVPYGTMMPIVGLRVERIMLQPGGVFRVFGKVTATGWLATVFAG
jgi:hypothetical protein